MKTPGIAYFVLGILIAFLFAIIGGFVAVCTFLTFWRLLVGVAIGFGFMFLAIWADKRCGSMWHAIGTLTIVGYFFGYLPIVILLRSLFRL